MKSIRLNLTIAAIMLLQVVSMNAMMRGPVAPIVGQRATATAAAIGMPGLMNQMRHQAHTVRADYGEPTKVDWQKVMKDTPTADQQTYWQQFKQSHKNYWQKQSQTAKDAWSDAKARARQGWQNTGRKVVGGGMLGGAGMYYYDHKQDSGRRQRAKDAYDLAKFRTSQEKASKRQSMATEVAEQKLLTAIESKDLAKVKAALEIIPYRSPILDTALQGIINKDYDSYLPGSEPSSKATAIIHALIDNGAHPIKAAALLIDKGGTKFAQKLLIERAMSVHPAVEDELKILKHQISLVEEKIEKSKHPWFFQADDFDQQSEDRTERSDLYRKYHVTKESAEQLKQAFKTAKNKGNVALMKTLAEKGALVKKQDIPSKEKPTDQEKVDIKMLKMIAQQQPTDIETFQKANADLLDRINNPHKFNWDKMLSND